MKAKSWFFLGVSVMVGAVAAPASAEPPERALQGCWNVAIHTPIFVPTIRARLKLALQNETLSGSISHGRWQSALRSTAVRGKRVRFVVDSPKGEARFSGALDDGELHGSVSGSKGTFSWAAKRC
jgi:hypothetical protein